MSTAGRYFVLYAPPAVITLLTIHLFVEFDIANPPYRGELSGTDFDVTPDLPPVTGFLLGLVAPFYVITFVPIILIAVPFGFDLNAHPVLARLLMTVPVPFFWFGTSQYLSECEWGVNRLLGWRFPVIVLSVFLGFFGAYGVLFTRHAGRSVFMAWIMWSISLACIAKFARFPAKH